MKKEIRKKRRWIENWGKGKMFEKPPKLAERYKKGWGIIKENAFKEGRYEILYPLYETKKEAKIVNQKEKGDIYQIKITLCQKK